MHDFIYESAPMRVVFGVGAASRVAEEVERLGATRALVLATPGRRAMAEDVATRLGARAIGVYAEARMHVPTTVAAAGVVEARRLDVDCVVAAGGGSTIGLAKAIAREEGIPIVALPTTYSGSEMTPIWGLTVDGVKTTGRDARVLPRSVIYDPLLTLGLPRAISGPSGMNAAAHCLEALYAPDTNPITSLMAEEGLRALAASLPAVVAAPGDVAARSDALYGAWLAGAALANVSMGIHHKLAPVVGGSFDLPHAEVHTILLPHSAAYNREAAPEAMARAARALGADDAATGLFDLAVAAGAKMALDDIGMAEADLDRAADIALRDPYRNPRPVTREGVRGLLDDAHHGRRPVR